MSGRNLTKEKSDKNLTQTGYSSPKVNRKKNSERSDEKDITRMGSDRSLETKENSSAGKLVRGNSEKNFNADGTSNREFNRDGSERSIGREKSLRFNKQESFNSSNSSSSSSSSSSSPTFFAAIDLDAMIKQVSSRDLISSDEIDDFINDIENNLSKDESKSSSSNNNSPRKTVKNSATRRDLLDGSHEFDRNGFLISKPDPEAFVLSTDELQRALDKEDERTDKWIYMLNHWDTFFLRKFSKVKSRVRKGIPHAIRGG